MKFKDILNQFEKRSLPLEVVFHKPKKETAFSRALFEIADAIAKRGGSNIQFFEGNGENVPDVPALVFRGSAGGSITYMALPEGREEAPFLEMLTWKLKGVMHIAENLRTPLEELAHPAAIWVFIAPACPNCPHAVRAANVLAHCSDNISTTVIDVVEFPHLAERFHIRSVPMTVLDDELLINEVVAVEYLTSKILSRCSDAHREDVFLSRLKTGNFDAASQQLLEQMKTSGFFLSAWQKSTLSDRLALMLVAKQALERNPLILDAIVMDLITVLDTSDVSLKGDTADLLGQIGHPDAEKPLETLLQDGNDDIVDIAEEALKHLKTRHD